MSAKNTYMKFDYMCLSHMRVKWNENCYQFFAGWEDLVLIIHIRTLRNVKIVVQERVFVLEDLVPICVNSTHLEKNHTSSSQTLYKFVPSETEKNTKRQ